MILPQAMRKVLPPLAGQFITLVKDSSIVSLISIQELTYLTQDVANTTTHFFEAWILTGVLGGDPAAIRAEQIADGFHDPAGVAVVDGAIYVSSREDGAVYRIGSNGDVDVYADELGTATGLAFDHEGILYVGDRRGTVFRIEPN